MDKWTVAEILVGGNIKVHHVNSVEAVISLVDHVHLKGTYGGHFEGHVSSEDIDFILTIPPLPGTEHASDDVRQPPPGSWAEVARVMAQGDDSGFDWDAWKDEMKESYFDE